MVVRPSTDPCSNVLGIRWNACKNNMTMIGSYHNIIGTFLAVGKHDMNVILLCYLWKCQHRHNIMYNNTPT